MKHYPSQFLPLLEAVGCKSDLGKTTKMPCVSYSLPASACQVGQQLAKLPGSTCAGCYADGRGNYSYQNVQNALHRRLASITHPWWVENMTALIRAKGDRYFRWHDSGDLQSVDHLWKINQIALRLPDVKFWLPTRETGIVTKFLRLYGNIHAPNLVIRISAAMVNGPAPKMGLPVSYVHTGVAARTKGAKVCPAPKQEGKCGQCRNCWDPTINVSYHKH